MLTEVEVREIEERDAEYASTSLELLGPAASDRRKLLQDRKVLVEALETIAGVRPYDASKLPDDDIPASVYIARTALGDKQ